MNTFVIFRTPVSLASMVIAAITLIAVTWDASTAVAAKPVFDATLYKGKPDLSAFGLQPINVIYEARFFSKKGDMAVPSQATLTTIGKEALGRGLLTVVDIERWKMWSGVGVPENVPKYVATLKGLKSAAPGIKIGYYATAPQGSYGTAQKDAASRSYVVWQGLNDSLKPIADVADATFPSIYTNSSDQQGWVNNATALIKEARRYGKPVYAFIWPQYADNANDPSLQLKYMPPDFWKLQLQTISKLADGIVIWGGWDLKNGGAQKWDNNAAWWQVTKDFIKASGAPTPTSSATGVIQQTR